MCSRPAGWILLAHGPVRLHVSKGPLVLCLWKLSFRNGLCPPGAKKGQLSGSLITKGHVHLRGTECAGSQVRQDRNRPPGMTRWCKRPFPPHAGPSAQGDASRGREASGPPRVCDADPSGSGEGGKGAGFWLSRPWRADGFPSLTGATQPASGRAGLSTPVPRRGTGLSHSLLSFFLS